MLPYLDSAEIIAEEIKDITHPTSDVATYSTQAPTLSTSVIKNVPATGEFYYTTVWASAAGTHSLEGTSYDTSFSAHALGGVRGASGPVGPIGTIGDQGGPGPQGPQGVGGLGYQVVTSDVQMVSNAGYIVNNSSINNRLILKLPTANATNGRLEIVGKTLGGWRVAQNTGQKIIFGYMETIEGTGGYIESSHDNDFVKLVCLSTSSYPTEFAVAGSVGSIIVY
jgi:hypothetical protein